MPETGRPTIIYNNVRVPASCLLGQEHRGFLCLTSELVQERLPIGITTQPAAQRAYDEAPAFVRERKVFGRPVIDFQNNRFTFVDLAARLQVGGAHVDRVIAEHVTRRLDGAGGESQAVA